MQYKCINLQVLLTSVTHPRLLPQSLLSYPNTRFPPPTNQTNITTSLLRIDPFSSQCYLIHRPSKHPDGRRGVVVSCVRLYTVQLGTTFSGAPGQTYVAYSGQGRMCLNPKLEILFATSCSNLSLWKTKRYGRSSPSQQSSVPRWFVQPINSYATLIFVVQGKIVKHSVAFQRGRFEEYETTRSSNL